MTAPIPKPVPREPRPRKPLKSSGFLKRTPAPCFVCGADVNRSDHSTCGSPACVSKARGRGAAVANGTLESRFWKRVDVVDGCWLWQGAKTPAGYGKMVHLGKHVGAHRFSFELHNGPIPDGLFVCHHCDTPACVNPEHLYAGTQADNVRDRTVRSRGHRPIGWNGSPHGPRTITSRLSEQDVRDIVAAVANGEKQKDVARRFGATASSISRIVNNDTFTGVSTLPRVNSRRRAKRLAEGKVYGPTHRAYDEMPCFLAGLHECWLPVRGHHRHSVAAGGTDSEGEIPCCVRAHYELEFSGEAWVEAKYGVSLDEVQAQSLATLTLR